MNKPTLVLMGSAGSGKGTQAERIIATYGYALVEGGALIREKATENSPKGRRVKWHDDQGHHAPDWLITELVSDRVAALEDQAGGAKPLLFDGYPRTLGQAKDLDSVLSYFGHEPQSVKVLWIRVPVDVARQRLLNRSVCTKCKTVYPSRDVKVCAKCGGEVKPRVYDTEAGIAERLTFFAEQTQPVIEYYAEQGRVVDVDGTADVDTVWQAIKSALDPLMK